MRALKRLLEKRTRRATIVAVAVLAVFGAAALAGPRSPVGSPLRLSAGVGRSLQGGGPPVATHPSARVAHQKALPKPATRRSPKVLHLRKASSAVFDARHLHGRVVKRERPEVRSPGGFLQAGETAAEAAPSTQAVLPERVTAAAIANAASAAPAPDSSFDGLDFANWGAGHPPDTNGDVGPNYFIQTVNTSIGIYDKTSHARV